MNALANHLKTNHEVDVPLLLADVADKQQCRETLDVRACKYIISLTFTQFKDLYCTGKWKDDATLAFASDVRMYQRRINAMCSRLISSEGVHHPKYKYAEGSTVGRLYISGDGGLQCLSKQLRYLLSTTDMVDYDIINCHPAIMLWICDSIGTLKTPYLEDYVNNRAEVLEKTGKDKTSILVMLNKDHNSPKGGCSWIQGLIHELKLNKQSVYDIIKDAYPKTNNKNNPISSTINKLWCEIEGRCIQTAIQTFLTDKDKCSMQFDGFQTNRKLDISELNKLTDELGLEWSVKEWTKADVPADFDEGACRSLANMMESLDRRFFAVREPEFAIWQEGSGGAKPIAQQSFMNASREYWFNDEHGKKRQSPASGLIQLPSAPTTRPTTWHTQSTPRQCYRGIHTTLQSHSRLTIFRQTNETPLHCLSSRSWFGNCVKTTKVPATSSSMLHI